MLDVEVLELEKGPLVDEAAGASKKSAGSWDAVEGVLLDVCVLLLLFACAADG